MSQDEKPEGKHYTKVADVMSTTIYFIQALATVREAINLMKERRVSSLVVPRQDPSDEFGLITISDIAGEVIGEDRALDRVNVYEIMNKPVMALPKDMNIKYAARMLNRFRLTRALVVDEKREPAGIVTLRDMVVHHAEQLHPSSDGSEEE